MQFLVNYTLNEIIFNRIDQRFQSKKISISNQLGTVPLHQLFEVLHKVYTILDKVQVANTPGVDLLKLYEI